MPNIECGNKIYTINDNRVTSIRSAVKSRKKRNKIQKNKTNKWSKLLIRCKGVSYNKFLKSDYWRAVRQIVLKRDGYRCVFCGETK